MVGFISRGDHSSKRGIKATATDALLVDVVPNVFGQVFRIPSLHIMHNVRVALPSIHFSFSSAQNCFKCCQHQGQSTDSHLGRNLSVEHINTDFSHRLYFTLCWHPRFVTVPPSPFIRILSQPPDDESLVEDMGVIERKLKCVYDKY